MWHQLSYIGIGLVTALLLGVGPALISYSLDSLFWWCEKKTGTAPAFKKDFGNYWLTGLVVMLGCGAVYGLGRLVSWLLFR